jgi:type I restriction enzyme, S subunit
VTTFAPVGDLLAFAVGGGWGDEEVSSETVACRVVRGTDLATARHGSLDGVPLRYETPKRLASRTLDAGDLILEISGGSKGQPTGRTALVTQRLLDRSQYPVIPASFCRLLRPDQSRVQSRYLYYWMQEMYSSGRVWAYQNQSTGIANFQMKVFTRAEMVRLPPLEEQERIAGVLGAFDDLIETNRRLIAGLDDLFQTLWRQDYDSRSNARRQTLAAVASTQYGLTASASDDPTGVKFLRVTDINKQNWINWEGVPTVPISEVQGHKYRLAVGDLLVARMADPGKSAIYEGGPDAVFASYLVRLKPDSYEDGLYLYGFLKSDEYAVYAAGAMTGSVQKNMNAKVISAATLHWPDEEARRAFAEKVAPIRRAQSALLTEATELARRRDELLPLLMSGKVRVRDVEGAVL